MLRRRYSTALAVAVLSVFGAAFASAATFAPSAVELDAMGFHRHDAEQFVQSLPEPQVDATGRAYYAFDDMRYAADAAQTDAAFIGRTWPGGVLYYQFEAGINTTRRQQWRDAAAVWSQVAPVTFVESTGNGNYVRVMASTGNSSYVGMLASGAQAMEIASWNSKFIIAHEIGHALGLIHEQSRRDRDSYVRILLNNVVSGERHNFDIENTSVPYGAYDFDSVMHYGRNDFSSNGGNTIEPLPAYSSYL